MGKDIEKSIDVRKRLYSIDAVKCIGIFLVVMFHAGVAGQRFYTLFFMAIFFVASGYCFNRKHTESLKKIFEYIVVLIRRLWVPYVVYNTLLLLLHNALVRGCLIPGEYKTFSEMARQLLMIVLFQGSELWAGAMWFVRALFFALIIFACITWFIQKAYMNENIVQSVASIAFLCIVWLFQNTMNDILFLSLVRQIALGYSCIWMGLLLSKINLLDRIKPVFCILCIIILLVCMSTGEINFNSGFITNPVFFIICSVSGFVLCAEAGAIILNSSIRTFVSYIARNTMWVLMLHFPAFKIIDFIKVKMYVLNQSKMTAFPRISEYNNVLFQIVYVFIGVIVPIFIKYLADGLMCKWNLNN